MLNTDVYKKTLGHANLCQQTPFTTQQPQLRPSDPQSAGLLFFCISTHVTTATVSLLFSS